MSRRRRKPRPSTCRGCARRILACVPYGQTCLRRGTTGAEFPATAKQDPMHRSRAEIEEARTNMTSWQYLKSKNRFSNLWLELSKIFAFTRPTSDLIAWKSRRSYTDAA